MLNPGADTGRFYSEVLLDKERLLSGNILSFVNPVRTTGHIYILTYNLSGQTGVIERKSGNNSVPALLHFTRHNDMLRFNDVASDAPYTICTADGAVVNRGRGNQVDLSGLNAGYYLVRIGGAALKFVK
jgi:hypothetical protein